MPLKFNKALIKGSLVLLISFNIFNFFNFLFHFSMIRMLNVAEYGVLASLFSIIYILGFFSESIQIVITKYTSGLTDKSKIKNILRKSLKKSTRVSVILFAAYLIISFPLSSLLKIDYMLMALNGLVIFAVFLSPVTRGILQGTKRFNQLGINVVVESMVKLLLAILLVYVGWMVYGAILGTILGMGISFILSLFSLRDVVRSKETKAKTAGIYGYTKPTFIIIMSVLIFYSIDVILAKIFFSEEIAGAYAVASTLAKAIFFATHPISKAMFPLSAESSKNKKSENVLTNSIGLVMIVVIPALLLFYFFPDFIIQIFSGKTLALSSSILFYVGLAVSLTAFTNLFLLYRLSTGKTSRYWLLPVFLALEIVLLSIFSHNLIEFSIAYITASAIFLWAVIFLSEIK